MDCSSARERCFERAQGAGALSRTGPPGPWGPGVALGHDSGQRVGRQLLFELPKELLQGVPLACSLSGFGRHWRSLASSGSSASLSQQVSEYDAFLSHDWATHRWLKMLTLHVHFNGAPAALASLLVGVLVGLLEGRGWFLWPKVTELLVVHGETLELRAAFWSYVLSLATFIGVFCFWQRVRELLGRPVFVFMDKLCISQKDPELKAQGILGLAGFLAQSKSLVILWSPRTFSRLWCAYEVVTWLLLEGKRRQQGLAKREAVLIPVNLSILLILSFMQVSMNSVWGLLEACWLRMGGSSGYYSIVMCGILINGFINILVAERLARDLVELPEQLERFDVRAVQCFCCSAGHIHPDTGEAIPCDRELVYEGLKPCFGGPGGDGEGHLEAFNEAVRTRFAPSIVHKAGANGLTYWHAWLCSGLPYLLAHTRRISYAHRMAWTPTLCLAADTAATGFLVIPTCVKALNRLAAFDPWGLKSGASAWLRTVCRALGYSVLAFVTWTPLELALRRPGSLPLLGAVLANLALTVLVFAGPRLSGALWWRTCGTSPKSPSAQGEEAP